MLTKLKTILFRDTESSFNYVNWLFGLFLIFISGLKIIHHFNEIVDVSFDDEVQYMRYGLDLFHQIRSDWGPSYNLWYKFLSLFENRPIELYLLNYKVVIILLPLCLFSFLYVYQVSFFVSLVMSLFVLVSGTNILTYPRISHIVVCLFLIVLVLNKLWVSSKARQYILFCFVIFVAAFARPELMLAFLILASYTLFYILKYDNFKKHIFFSLPFLTIMILLFIVFRLPSGSFKGIDRAYIAFCQHYTIKHIISHKGHFNQFIDWIAFSREQFAGCNTFTDIVLKYPLVVIKGMFVNLGFYLLLIVTTCTDFIFPAFIVSINKLKYGGYVLVLFLIFFTFISKKQRIALFQIIQKNRLLFGVLLVFILPSIASSIVFFPRMHYSIFLLPLLSFVFANLIDGYFSFNRVRFIITIIIVAFFIYKIPSIKKYNTPMLVTMDNCTNQNYKTVIRKLNKNSDKPHVIFSNILSFSYMIDKNFTDFGAEYDYDNSKTFKEQMEAHHVDYILQTKFLTEDRRLSKDSTWLQFTANPEAYGFKKEKLFDDCETYLLYKE